MKEKKNGHTIEIYGMVPISHLPAINSLNELKAVVAISSFQGLNEKAWPRLEVLAERAAIDFKAMSKAVSGLVRKGLVVRKKHLGKPNSYSLIWQTQTASEFKGRTPKMSKEQRRELLKANLEKSRSSESIGYPKVSDNRGLKTSDINHPKVSDIYIEKNNIKEAVEAEPPKDFEQLFTEEIQKFSLEINNSKLRIGFGESKLGELISLCDKDISILRKKLEHYREKRKANSTKSDQYLAANPFSIGFLLQVWNDLAASEKVIKYSPNKVDTKPKEFSPTFD